MALLVIYMEKHEHGSALDSQGRTGKQKGQVLKLDKK